MAEQDNQAAPKKGKLKTIILLVVVVILAVGLSVAGTLFFLTSGSDGDNGATARQPAEPAFQPAMYYAFERPFITTIRAEGRQRYIQVFIAVQARDQAPLDATRTHLPLLRSRLQSMLADQEFMLLQTVEGRQQLADDMLVVVNEVLEAEGAQAVERVLFTNLVLQ